MASDPRPPRENSTRQASVPVPANAPPVLSWILDAACADADPDAFAAATPAAESAAKATCARCPVRPECRDYAITTAQEWGVWGGLSEAERKALLDPQSDHASAGIGGAA